VVSLISILIKSVSDKYIVMHNSKVVELLGLYRLACVFTLTLGPFHRPRTQFTKVFVTDIYKHDLDMELFCAMLYLFSTTGVRLPTDRLTASVIP